MRSSPTAKTEAATSQLPIKAAGTLNIASTAACIHEMPKRESNRVPLNENANANAMTANRRAIATLLMPCVVPLRWASPVYAERIGRLIAEPDAGRGTTSPGLAGPPSGKSPLRRYRSTPRLFTASAGSPRRVEPEVR
jgi:hypothetical protein